MICGCAQAILELLLLAGDVEENPGAKTQSTTTQASCDIMSVLSGTQAAKATFVNDVQSVSSKFTENKKVFDDIKEEIGETKGVHSTIMFIYKKWPK